MFSLFQILGHVFEMNIKLKTWYNPGLFTTLFLFLPIGIAYIKELLNNNLVTPIYWLFAIFVLIASILITIIAPVQLLKNKETKYIISTLQMKKFKKIVKFSQIKK